MQGAGISCFFEVSRGLRHQQSVPSVTCEVAEALLPGASCYGEDGLGEAAHPRDHDLTAAGDAGNKSVAVRSRKSGERA